MATTTVSIRIDEELKRQAEDLFADLGLNLTTAMTSFIRQSVREQRIPFALTRNIPNEETRRTLDAVLRGEGYSPAYSSLEELKEALNA